MSTTTIMGGNILKVTRQDGEIYWLPNPQKMQVDVQDLDADNTGRNQKGTLKRDRVRGGATAVRKVNCTFAPMGANDMKLTLQAVKDATFTLQFPDPYTGATRSSIVYVGDRNAPMYSLISNTWLWQSLSMNFVEV